MWRKSPQLAPNGCQASYEVQIPTGWTQSSETETDLYYWTLTPNANIRRDMSSTLLDDACTNHQLGVFMVTASFGKDTVTWEVPDIEPAQPVTSCPIITGWSSCAFVCQSLCGQVALGGSDQMSSTFIGGDYVSSELTVLRSFPKKESEVKKISQPGLWYGVSIRVSSHRFRTGSLVWNGLSLVLTVLGMTHLGLNFFGVICVPVGGFPPFGTRVSGLCWTTIQPFSLCCLRWWHCFAHGDGRSVPCARLCPTRRGLLFTVPLLLRCWGRGFFARGLRAVLTFRLVFSRTLRNSLLHLARFGRYGCRIFFSSGIIGQLARRQPAGLFTCLTLACDFEKNVPEIDR